MILTYEIILPTPDRSVADRNPRHCDRRCRGADADDQKQRIQPRLERA